MLVDKGSSRKGGGGSRAALCSWQPWQFSRASMLCHAPVNIDYLTLANLQHRIIVVRCCSRIAERPSATPPYFLTFFASSPQSQRDRPGLLIRSDRTLPPLFLLLPNGHQHGGLSFQYRCDGHQDGRGCQQAIRTSQTLFDH